MDWYLDPSRWDTPLATSGPADWPTADANDLLDADIVEVDDPAEVSNVERTNNSISFTVDEPGTPVLVKESNFPNWKASGADGPWRVSPNFMVVVPTENEVTLSYGRTLVDYLGWLLTFVGIGVFVVLLRSDDRKLDLELAGAGDGGRDDGGPGEGGPGDGDPDDAGPGGGDEKAGVGISESVGGRSGDDDPGADGSG
jgi:hypothetical protein